MFLYDTDGDGGIGDREIGVFMDAYDRGLPFADADLDGRVDSRDLRAYVRFLEGL